MHDLLDSPQNTVIYGIKVSRKKYSRDQICTEKYIKQDSFCENICPGCMLLYFAYRALERFSRLLYEQLKH